MAVGTILQNFIFDGTRILARDGNIIGFIVRTMTSRLLVAEVNIILHPFVGIYQRALAIQRQLGNSLFQRPTMVANFQLILRMEGRNGVNFVVQAPNRHQYGDVALLF